MLLSRIVKFFKIDFKLFIFILFLGLYSCSVYWTEGGDPLPSGTVNNLNLTSTMSPEDAKELDDLYADLNYDPSEDYFSTQNQNDVNSQVLEPSENSDYDELNPNFIDTDDHQNFPDNRDTGIIDTTPIQTPEQLVESEVDEGRAGIGNDNNRNNNTTPSTLYNDPSIQEGQQLHQYVTEVEEQAHQISQRHVESSTVVQQQHVETSQSVVIEQHSVETRTELSSSYLPQPSQPPAPVAPVPPVPPRRSRPVPVDIREITDYHVCENLTNLVKNASILPNFSESNLKNFKAAVGYFCKNNADNLKKLRANSYTGREKVNDIFVDKYFEKRGNNGSYLATATASKELGIKLDVYPYVSSSYCEGFNVYKPIYGENNVKEIDFIKILESGFITQPLFHSRWCSFHLKSKPLFFVLIPEYKGVLIHNMFLNNRLFIELNYVVEPISLVKDFLAVGIAYNNPDGSLTSYSYRFMASVKTAFHDTLVKSSIDKAKDIAAKRFEVNKRLNSRF